jgi:hypothetical protein
MMPMQKMYDRLTVVAPLLANGWRKEIAKDLARYKHAIVKCSLGI